VSAPGRLLVRGGRVVDPSQGIDGRADLLIEDGKIVALADSIEADGVAVLEAAGKVVTPGLIDSRVQFGEPGYEPRESLRSGLRAAAAGGFTAVLGLPATQPWNDQRAVTDLMVGEAARHPYARFYPVAALSRGGAGEELSEYGELAAAGAVAFSDGALSVTNGALLRRALLYARHFDLPVLNRPADRELEDGGVMHEGEWSTRLGLPAMPAVAEEVAIARDLLLARETGGRYHLSLLSTAGGVAQVRAAKLAGLQVTCDVAIHHLLLRDREVADSVFSPATKVRPPLRGDADVSALRVALADGTIDALVSDHAPCHADEKDAQFSVVPFGISGLETLVPLALDRLVGQGLLSLSRLVELLSLLPASLYGLPGGTLREGAPADLTVLDLDKDVGIDPKKFESRGRCTPFAGWRLRGGVAATLVGGRVISLS
jgi:dihydroorotase